MARDAAVCGVDVGGTGCRAVVLGPAGRKEALVTRGVSVTDGGIDIPALLRAIREAVAEASGGAPADTLASIAVGMTGLLALAPDRPAIHDALHSRFGAAHTIVASDALTSLLGALHGQPGAIVAAGTGVIGLGTDFRDIWHRVDGWGHVLGDEGGGTWIGAAGLRAAMASYDGRDGGSAPLLAALRQAFGSPEKLTAELYTRSDRAGMLAGFVPHVARAAEDGDPAAADILVRAGGHLARAAAAAVDPGVPPLLGLIGGIVRSLPLLSETARAELARTRPDIRIVEDPGTSLDGALRLAAMAADGQQLPSHETYITAVRHG